LWLQTTGQSSTTWLPWLAALKRAKSGSWRNCGVRRLRSENGVFHFMEIKAHRMAGVSKLQTGNGTFRFSRSYQGRVSGFRENERRGSVFIRRSSGNPNKRHASKGGLKSYAEWIRGEGFDNPRKAPNHAFRHWWKRRRRVSMCKIASPTRSKDMPDIPLHQPTRHFRFEELAEASPPFPYPPRKTRHPTKADAPVSIHDLPVDEAWGTADHLGG